MNNKTFSTELENNIYKIKRINRTNMWLLLLQYVPAIILALIFVLPIVKIDLIFAEENISLLDIFISSSSNETLKGSLASSLGAKFLGVPQENYTNFITSRFMNLDSENFLTLFSQLLSTFLLFLSIFFFVFYLVIRPIVLTIPSIVKSNIEGSLRRADQDTFNSFFYNEREGFCFDFESNKTIRNLFDTKAMKKLFIKWLIGIIIVFGASVFFVCKTLLFISKIEFVSINPIFYIFSILCLTLIFIGIIWEYFYSIKYAHTLSASKSLKQIF